MLDARPGRARAAAVEVRPELLALARVRGARGARAAGHGVLPLRAALAPRVVSEWHRARRLLGRVRRVAGQAAAAARHPLAARERHDAPADVAARRVVGLELGRDDAGRADAARRVVPRPVRAVDVPLRGERRRRRLAVGELERAVRRRLAVRERDPAQEAARGRLELGVEPVRAAGVVLAACGLDERPLARVVVDDVHVHARLAGRERDVRAHGDAEGARGVAEVDDAEVLIGGDLERHCTLHCGQRARLVVVVAAVARGRAVLDAIGVPAALPLPHARVRVRAARQEVAVVVGAAVAGGSPRERGGVVIHRSAPDEADGGRGLELPRDAQQAARRGAVEADEVAWVGEVASALLWRVALAARVDSSGRAACHGVHGGELRRRRRAVVNAQVTLYRLGVAVAARARGAGGMAVLEAATAPKRAFGGARDDERGKAG
mmetsp:Transcript_12177/g.42739  ORF Transcript_12177/g.42739 Transcript_12177/m.42739 type:complete len:437 (+) Transcript_12177:1440-2750(+)